MANPQDVELEAAKFLHKLIQESRDEPTKLATKLYVILHHMRSSGKENSMPYQVISRAMETVIKEHNLDIESLMSPRPPLASGSQIGDTAPLQLVGSSQQAGADKDPKPSFSGNEMGTPDTNASARVHTGPASVGPNIYQGSAANASGSYLSAESGNRMEFGNSSFDGQVFAEKTSKDRNMEVLHSIPLGDLSSGKSLPGKTLDHGGSSMVKNANKGCSSSSVSETNVLRTNTSMDNRKFPICQDSISGRPFNDQQLKQLRAQCLVFLAFRNGLMPKQLHLQIALGNINTKEDESHRDLVDQKGKEQLVTDSSKGHPPILNSYSPKEDDFAKLSDVRTSQLVIPAENELDRKKSVAKGKANAEVLTYEANELHVSAQLEARDSITKEIINHNHEDDMGNSRQPSNTTAAFMALGEQSKVERGRSQNLVDINSLDKCYSDKKLSGIPMNEPWKPVTGISGQNYPEIPSRDSNVIGKNVPQVSGADHEEDYCSISAERLPSPKHTITERWILERQKRKLLTEQNWAHKQLETEQRISSCSDKLKEIVSSSEDISAKTKSVIELKKLQLLEFQRRLRSDILSDFFKPIANEMDKLKSIKKHRIGRRSKQMERYEQRMKEERLKRTREKQKEFFGDLEFHRERLEDGFKIKRERWKGHNRYAREFHKRKERLHREKIDRIQREKINLLKINDVEGYLRMVQDAKSDRVKQLLKETEKYLQKLGSKLKDAKAMARHFDTDMEESNLAAEENEDSVENDDDAKHYLESNEKYYTMAHSVKENILEQPVGLIGGKLRGYQMNGLRWLVSLYNNHLNGILADEMGLGKTVQVISLICHLMEVKNDRGPFLVVVPSSVLPGWESEIKFWAPGIHRIVYNGPPEERRRLFKEHIVHQKFNVLLTTYEYLMNKHDRPKLSKIQWHYVIIDEGHRIKNASCKLNAELKHYRSNHRLLLTGTPLQNNLEELWALLNFLLPNIFNSSDDFSQWFNKPFESNGDNSPDEALLSEEENLLIINRLHQVLRPFVLRRLKHKVENELPEKIERLIRCEASSYQKLLMKRVEDNLGAIGTSKARSVHNSVMELRNICNHPYLSQLHVEEVHDLIPKHYLPHVVRLCGKLEMLDRLLPKLKATDHRILFFSTMTRLLDVMEDYLTWKKYKYLRLDGHTSGGDRGGLIEQFNQPDSPYFIFLLSIRAGGVGVNLQAADTVIIFDTDWNPQVDLQAQARAHRIGQKKDVLVLRLETVQTVEEQVRASAEHKLGVANQSITAGFFDNNTSAEDRREYLESLLRENKKEEVAHVLDDDSLNDIIARREEEIDIFESVDKQRRDEEMAAWRNMVEEGVLDKTMEIPPLPSRLLTEDDLKSFYEMIKTSDKSTPVILPNAGVKRKSGYLGGLDTQQYGRGKRAREVRSYEEQMTEEEFERICAVESPGSPIVDEEVAGQISMEAGSNSAVVVDGTQAPEVTVESMTPENKVATSVAVTTTLPSKKGRGRPKKVAVNSPPLDSGPPPPGFEKPEVFPMVETTPAKPPPGFEKTEAGPEVETTPVKPPPGFEKTEAGPKVETTPVKPSPDSLLSATYVRSITGSMQESRVPVTNSGPTIIAPSATPTPQTGRGRGRGRKPPTGDKTPASRRRGKVQAVTLQSVPLPVSQSVTTKTPIGEIASSSPVSTIAVATPVSILSKEVPGESNPSLSTAVVPPASPVVPSAPDQSAVNVKPKSGIEPDPVMASVQTVTAHVASVNNPDPGIVSVSAPSSGVLASQSITPSPPVIVQGRGRGRGRGRGQGLNAQSQQEKPPVERKRRRKEPVVSMVSGVVTGPDAPTEPPKKRTRASGGRKDKGTVIGGDKVQELKIASTNAAHDVKGDSANQVPKGTAEEKFADAPQDQTANAKEGKDNKNEVPTLNPNSSDAVQSVLTSDPAAKAPSVISESGNQSAGGCDEPNDRKIPDNKDSCEDDSLVSVPVMFGIDNERGSSEDPQYLLIIGRDFSEIEKDQGVNGSTIEAATASEGSNSMPVSSSVVSVETDKGQVLDSAKVHDASAIGSMAVPVESGKSDSPVKEGGKITESSENPTLDESSTGMMKNIDNESEELQKDKYEDKTTKVEIASVEQVTEDNVLKGVSSDAVTDPVAVASMDLTSGPQVSAQDNEDPSTEHVSIDTDIRVNKLDEQVSDVKESAVTPKVPILATYDVPLDPIFEDANEKLPTEEPAEGETAAPLEEISVPTTEQDLRLNTSSDIVFEDALEVLPTEEPGEEDAVPLVQTSVTTTEQVLHPNSLSDGEVNKSSDVHPEEKPAASDACVSTDGLPSKDEALDSKPEGSANETPGVALEGESLVSSGKRE